MKESAKNHSQIAEPGQRWGTFQDAEYWRKQDFLRWTPAQRLNWLCEMLSIAYGSGALKPFGQ